MRGTQMTNPFAEAKEHPGRPVQVVTPDERAALKTDAERLRREAARLDQIAGEDNADA